MIGILAEKPSAARNMAKAFGGMTGAFNQEPYLIVAARGHCYELADPEEQVPKGLSARYKSWSLENLPWDFNDFQWKYHKKKDVDDVLKAIKAGLSKCDEICIATDDDPTGEGQLLAWEILSQIGVAAKKYTRMYFTDESVKELQKAFKARKTLPPMQQDPDYIKAFYRSRWDFMSMQFTRIATRCGDGHSILRQGRLKSAMVKLVGDQLKEVANYKKVPFYENRFKDENGIVYSDPNAKRYPEKSQVPNDLHDSDVVCDSKDMKHTVPPKMLDLAALSAKLAPKGVKAKEVLDVYQKMYEAQIVSYPRTEDKVISPEQFNDLLPLVDKIAGVVGVDTKLLTHRQPRPTHVKAGGAHGANRPGTTVPSSLADLSKYGACAPMIYELLAKNYLATLAEDYEYEYQKGHVKDYPSYVGSASIPKKPGWRAVYDDGDDSIEETASGLGIHAAPFVHEGFPPKPSAPTVKWLMAQLERRDVGTGATRTSIYAEVTNEKSKYPLMKEVKGKLSLTECGDMSYRLLPDTNIGSLDMTEKLMNEMRQIAEGKLNPDDCLKGIADMVRQDMDQMQKNSITMRKELNIMAGQNAEKYDCTWNGRQISFKKQWSTHTFTDEECEALARGETISFTAEKKDGSGTYVAKGKLAEQEFNGHKYVGFSLSTDSCPTSWCQHTFTEDEINALEAGVSIERDDWVSKKGKVFSAKLRWGKNDEGKMALIPEFG